MILSRVDGVDSYSLRIHSRFFKDSETNPVPKFTMTFRSEKIRQKDLVEAKNYKLIYK